MAVQGGCFMDRIAPEFDRAAIEAPHRDDDAPSREI
jgi:hypothetical protein